MGMRNVGRELLRRLEGKTLEARFLTTVGEGLGCSPFEAHAVLDVVKEVFFPFVREGGAQALPGKVTLVAVCADEPAGKAIAQCEKQTVVVTVHRGVENDRLLAERGLAAARARRVRLPSRIYESGRIKG